MQRDRERVEIHSHNLFHCIQFECEHVCVHVYVYVFVHARILYIAGLYLYAWHACVRYPKSNHDKAAFVVH